MTRTPVNEGQVGVRKDGKRLRLISCWADAEGRFELRLDTGPGEYRCTRSLLSVIPNRTTSRT